jgi:replicative DNA helicase
MTHSPSVEDRLLGGMMRNNATIGHVLAILRPEDIQTNSNKAVLSAIVALHNSGMPVNADQVATHLGVNRVMAEVGGYSRLADLWICACAGAEVSQLVETLVESRRLEKT